MRVLFRGRRTIWWCWGATSVAPRNLKMTLHVGPGSIMRILFRGRRYICWCWTVTFVAPRNVNDVSCITRINDEISFWRQTQYLAMLEGNFCCSAQCKWRFMWPGSIIESPFSWQAQYLVMLEGNLCCSAQCKWPFTWDQDQPWESFFVVGAIFADVGR